jgi:hypothetical protein
VARKEFGIRPEKGRGDDRCSDFFSLYCACGECAFPYLEEGGTSLQGTVKRSKRK